MMSFRKTSLGFEDLGEVIGKVFYQPSILDMRLLKGTKQWKEILQREDFDDSTTVHDESFIEEEKT